MNLRSKHHLHRPNTDRSCFKKSTLYAGIKQLISLPRSLKILTSEKATFKAAPRKYINTLSFSPVDVRFMSNYEIEYCFINVCSILYCKNCVFMNRSHSIVFVTHLWIMECMYEYVRMYVCMYVCTYVRRYICMHA